MNNTTNNQNKDTKEKRLLKRMYLNKKELKKLPENEKAFITKEYKELSHFLINKHYLDKHPTIKYFLLRYKEYLSNRMECLLWKEKQMEKS